MDWGVPVLHIQVFHISFDPQQQRVLFRRGFYTEVSDVLLSSN